MGMRGLLAKRNNLHFDSFRDWFRCVRVMKKSHLATIGGDRNVFQ
jgi:hypothetical protein